MSGSFVKSWLSRRTRGQLLLGSGLALLVLLVVFAPSRHALAGGDGIEFLVRRAAAGDRHRQRPLPPRAVAMVPGRRRPHRRSRHAPLGACAPDPRYSGRKRDRQHASGSLRRPLDRLLARRPPRRLGRAGRFAQSLERRNGPPRCCPPDGLAQPANGRLVPPRQPVAHVVSLLGPPLGLADRDRHQIAAHATGNLDQHPSGGLLARRDAAGHRRTGPLSH